MNGLTDFESQYGKTLLQNVLDNVVNHSELRSSKIPEDVEQRLYYSLLSILDFECNRYGDAPKGLDDDDIQNFLKKHRDSIKCEPPTYLGMLGGRFDFLI